MSEVRVKKEDLLLIIYCLAQHDHDGHGTNPILFNETNKDWKPRTLATPHHLRPITSHFSFILPPPPQSGRRMCITPKDEHSNVWRFVYKKNYDTTLLT